MNEINGFTFYKNYYELIDCLPKKDKLLMLENIVDYVFKDIEPTGLKGMNQAIWNNIVLPINTSKNNSLRSIGKGAPKGNQNASKKTNQRQTKNKPKTNQTGNQKQTNNISISISNFLFLFSNLYISNLNNKDNIYKLFKEYLELRTKNKYTVTETVVKRLINKLNEYGTTDKEKIEIITNAINGAWKDFYPLKKHEEKPNWYGKEQEETSASDDEIKELEERLKRI